MPAFQQLPQFQAPTGINFDPLNQGVRSLGNALAQRQTVENNRNITNALSRKDYAGAQAMSDDPNQALQIGQYQQRERSADQELNIRDDDLLSKRIDRVGGMAQAALAEKDPSKRAQIMNAIYSSHPGISDHVQKYGFDPNDHVGTANLLAAEAQKYRDPLDREYKKAQIDLMRSRGNYFDNRTLPSSTETNTTIMPGKGLDEDGNLVDVNASNNTPPSQFGETGRTAETIPGIVVTPKGVTDRAATIAQRGQDAISATPDATARQRLLDRLDNQNKWTVINGKAPSGFYYDADGTLVDMKDASKKKVASERAGPMIQDIQTAKDVLIGNDSANPRTGVIGRNIAMTPWARMLTPETTGAMENLKHTVATMTALVEGNRHANAQDVRFLKYFAIEPDDTTDAVGRKLDQLNRIYNTYIGNKAAAQPGTIYKSKTQQAGDAVKAGSMPSGAYVYDPATGEMKPK